MIQEEVAAAVIIASKEKKPKEFDETLRLEDEYNSKIILRMTSENSSEKIFQLIKEDITKEITKMRELILPRL